jgi:hypothetical protein
MNHTYGTKCRLAPVTQPASTGSGDDVPPITAQFFYSSVIPIDDPLSPSTIVSSSDPKSFKGQLRPFSHGDNNALEKVWLNLMSSHDRASHQDARRNHGPEPSVAKANVQQRTSLVKGLAKRHWEKHGQGHQPQDLTVPGVEMLPSSPVPVCCSELFVDAAEELRNGFCALYRKRQYELSTENVVQEVMMELKQLRSMANTSEAAWEKSYCVSSSGSNAEVTPQPEQPADVLRRASRSNRGGKDLQSELSEFQSRTRSLSQATEKTSRPATPAGAPISPRPPVLDDGISGKPFVRVGTPETSLVSSPPSVPRVSGIAKVALDTAPAELVSAAVEVEDSRESTAPANSRPAETYRRSSCEVAVGISRLHMVSLPLLQMKPIYWSPINDLAIVLRATWFYK